MSLNHLLNPTTPSPVRSPKMASQSVITTGNDEERPADLVALPTESRAKAPKPIESVLSKPSEAVLRGDDALDSAQIISSPLAKDEGLLAATVVKLSQPHPADEGPREHRKPASPTTETVPDLPINGDQPSSHTLSSTSPNKDLLKPIKVESATATPTPINEEPQVTMPPPSQDVSRKTSEVSIDRDMETPVSPLKNNSAGSPTPSETNSNRGTKRKSSAIAPGKKGIAGAKKAPPKKRQKKSSADSPGSSRSNTPMAKNSARAQNAKSRLAAVATDIPSADIVLTDAGDEEEDGEANDDDVFCLCKKPDDHKFMIGCDGCDDWFHAACVAFKPADAELVHKWFCPNCAGAGIGKTKWRPKCSLVSCRKAARNPTFKEHKANGVTKVSKFCSDEHGREFWAVQRDRMEKDGVEDGPVQPPGGALTQGQAASLFEAAKDVAAFQDLGKPKTSITKRTQPKETQTELGEDAMIIDGHDATPPNLDVHNAGNGTLTPDPSLVRITEINLRTTTIEQNLSVLARRESLLQILRDQQKALRARESNPRLCGYNPLLGMNGPEFEAWRTTPEGEAFFMNGSVLKDGDADSVCMNKSCGIHRDWPKLQKEDLEFSKARAKEEMMSLRKETESLLVRKEMEKLNGAGEEGGVEVVGH